MSIVAQENPYAKYKINDCDVFEPFCVMHFNISYGLCYKARVTERAALGFLYAIMLLLQLHGD